MPGQIDDSLPALHTYVAGSTGSGKTSLVRQAIARDPRVLIYDPDGTHAGPWTDNLSSLARHLAEKTKNRAPFRYCFRPPDGGTDAEVFDKWCAVVWAVADCRWPIAVVVEEVGGVANGPGRALGNWHKLLTRGRKYGLRIFAISQRPQEVPKTVIGQCTTIATGALFRRKDRIALAEELDIEYAAVTGLAAMNKPDSPIKHLWCRRGTGEVELLEIDARK